MKEFFVTVAAVFLAVCAGIYVAKHVSITCVNFLANFCAISVH